MDVLNLIDEIEDIVEAGSSIPFSGRVMIEKEEVLDIIKEIRIKLPDEIKQAAWILEEKQRILTEAQKDAMALTDQAEKKLEELIDENRITKEANAIAEEIIEKARSNAKDIRLGAIEYADGLLEDTQEGLKEVLNLISDNRKELRGEK